MIPAMAAESTSAGLVQPVASALGISHTMARLPEKKQTQSGPKGMLKPGLDGAQVVGDFPHVEKV